MAPRPALVSQQEVKRTVTAAIAAGVRIGRIEVDHRAGKVTIVPEGAAEAKTRNPCDRLLE